MRPLVLLAAVCAVAVLYPPVLVVGAAAGTWVAARAFRVRIEAGE